MELRKSLGLKIDKIGLKWPILTRRCGNCDGKRLIPGLEGNRRPWGKAEIKKIFSIPAN
jgi:hypothetical protein